MKFMYIIPTYVDNCAEWDIFSAEEKEEPKRFDGRGEKTSSGNVRGQQENIPDGVFQQKCICWSASQPHYLYWGTNIRTSWLGGGGSPGILWNSKVKFPNSTKRFHKFHKILRGPPPPLNHKQHTIKSAAEIYKFIACDLYFTKY